MLSHTAYVYGVHRLIDCRMVPLVTSMTAEAPEGKLSSKTEKADQLTTQKVIH